MPSERETDDGAGIGAGKGFHSCSLVDKLWSSLQKTGESIGVFLYLLFMFIYHFRVGILKSLSTTYQTIRERRRLPFFALPSLRYLNPHSRAIAVAASIQRGERRRETFKR